MHHNIGFQEKRIFPRKLGKIAENCDHHIEPGFKKIASAHFCSNLEVHISFNLASETCSWLMAFLSPRFHPTSGLPDGKFSNKKSKFG
jgi:hypothetical protein